MKINKHNLTIVTHCASKVLQGYVTNGLQFTREGTIAINGAYSVAVSALQVDAGEPVGCITPEEAGDILGAIGDGDWNVPLADTGFMKGTPAVIKWGEKPPVFEIFLNADYLVKILQSARDFCEPTAAEDAVVRIQFTGQNEPARMDARNTKTGQKWEALLMPRKPVTDEARFAATTPPSASPFPPPPPVDPDLTRALALAEGLYSLGVEDPFAEAMRIASGL